MRLPSPAVYRWWREGMYQSPERIPAIFGCSLPPFKQTDLMTAVKKHHKLPADTFTALGIRCADSIFRRAMFVRTGAINWKEKKFYSNWDWTKEALIAEMRKAGVKLPVDYWIFGRSFDGLDYRFIAPVKRHFPEDYGKLLEYYPLMDSELMRAEFTGMSDHLPVTA